MVFAFIRRNAKASNLLLTIAVLFIVSGTAFAGGKFLINSTKQINPKVIKALKGKQGPMGLTGAVGPKGETGPAGKNGVNGINGVNGNVGPVGPTGPTGSKGATGPVGATGPGGAPGATGPQGSPWTAGGKLPSGSTETGVWTDTGQKENGAVVQVPISFTLPVANEAGEPPKAEFVLNGTTGANCTGSVTAPTAPEGWLCVYDEVPNLGSKFTHVNVLGFGSPELAFEDGLSNQGTFLQVETTEVGDEEGPPFTAASGIWAVTAE